MSDDLKFTVIIPTRERADVLSSALQTVVAQDYENLEILVSDNSSSDHTVDVVRSFSDPRICYRNTGQRLSMSHNYEFALSQVKGGWVTILGDDDGLMPGALKYVSQVVDAYGVNIVRSSISSYLWPSMMQSSFGRLTVDLRRGCELRGSQEWLSRLVRGQVPFTALPALYTGGFVDYQLVERVRSVSGQFYRSMFPDVYSAVALSKVTDNYVYCHEQLAMGGASKHSTGASQFLAHKARGSDSNPAGMFYSEANIPFHSDLSVVDRGPPPSIQILVYESLMQSESLGSSASSVIKCEQQLEIALRNAKRRNRAEIVEWGKLLAKRHNIDFELVSRRSSKINYREKIAKNGRKLVDQLNTINLLGSSDLPLRDVHEASIVAAAIKEFQPSVIARAIRKFMP